MSEFLKLPAAINARLTRFLASWVNLDVKDPGTVRKDTALFGHLFALPAIALASTALQSTNTANTDEIVTSLALAFSLPVLAAGYLSFSGSKTIRSVISVTAMPAFYLAATKASAFFPEAALLAGLLANRALKESLLGKRDLIVGAALTGAIALAGGTVIAASSAILGLAAFMLSGKAAETTSDQVPEKNTEDFAVPASLIVGNAEFVLETDRGGIIHQVHGNRHEFNGRRLADMVHIADKVALLTALDGLEAGLSQSAQLEVRLSFPVTDGATGSFDSVALRMAKHGDRILIVGRLEVGAAIAPTGEIAPVANVCHEMRTPLNAIIGFSEMLGNGLAGELANERQSEYVTLINRSGQHLLDVVNAMLDLSAAENGSIPVKSSRFLPDEIAMLSINMLAAQAKAKKIGLEYMPMNSAEPFEGDRRICQQILVNLLSNAVKFTETGGRIRLLIDATDDRLSIEVADTGIGMSEGELAQAGTPYFRVIRSDAKSGQGSGLGLALVRKMAAQHGGSVEMESVPGKGTRVRAVLTKLSVSETGDNGLSVLRPPKEDESARIIRISEEQFDEAPRKTA